MQILFGTTNKAKLDFIRDCLTCFDSLEIIGLRALDLDLTKVKIDENGKDPLENAGIKANTYYDLLQSNNIDIPVFSCDSGLFIAGLPDNLQPGTHVRNVNDKYLSDDEMLDYYANIAKNMGGQMTAQYRNAICLVMTKDGEKKIYEHIGDDIDGNTFIISQTPHIKRTPGFPIDSLSIEINSGKYYFDLGTDFVSEADIYTGYKHFFAKVFDLTV